MLVLALIGLGAYAAASFRRAVRSDGSARLVAEAERIVSFRNPGSHWARPAFATLVAWVGIMATLTPVDPTMAVWIGGVVIATGTAAVVRSIPNPFEIDDEQFERELRELLDQHSA